MKNNTSTRPKRSRLRLLSYVLLIGAVLGVLFTVFMFWFWVYARPVYPLAAERKGADGVYTLAAPLPTAMTESSGAFCNGKYYQVGGIGPVAQTFNTLFAYDPQTDSWSKEPDLPFQISHTGVIGHDKDLYIIAGVGPLGLRLRWFMVAEWRPLDQVLIYNTETKTFRYGTPMPGRRGAGGICKTDDGFIWYVGGIAEDLEVNASLFRYSIEDDSWSTMPEMPTARDHL